MIRLPTFNAIVALLVGAMPTVGFAQPQEHTLYNASEAQVQQWNVQEARFFRNDSLIASLTFDEFGRKVAEVDLRSPETQHIQYDYSVGNQLNVATWRDAEGSIVQFVKHRKRGRGRVALRFQLHDDRWFRHSRIRYDEAGQWLQWTSYNPKGQLSGLRSRRLDAHGRAVKEKYMAGRMRLDRKVEYEYTGNGNVYRKSTWHNQDMLLPPQIRYLDRKLDHHGRVIENYKAGKLSARHAYDAAGHKIQTLFYDESEEVTRIDQFEYDEAGNLIRYTEHTHDWKLQREISYRYTADGVLIGRQDRDVEVGLLVEYRTELSRFATGR